MPVPASAVAARLSAAAPTLEHVTATAVDTLLDGLNPQQRAAVVHEGSPLLIVAGAGSGKTRVLTYRIAYLLAEREVSPAQILAITFTNKAAGEMAARAAALTGSRARSMWLLTFHSAWASGSCAGRRGGSATHAGCSRSTTRPIRGG